MKFFKTRAKCPECGLVFEYALSEEDMEDELAQEVFCPRCGELATYKPYVQCSEQEYHRILEEYDELEETYEFEELDLGDLEEEELEEEEEEEW